MPLAFLVAMAPIHAAAPGNWQFVYVNRSSDLNVISGEALLTGSSGKLSGTLTAEHDVQFSIDANINGDEVTATFGSLESDDGGTRLNGTFRQTTMLVPGGTNCRQTIQLSDGFSSLALARNVPSCES